MHVAGARQGVARGPQDRGQGRLLVADHRRRRPGRRPGRRARRRARQGPRAAARRRSSWSPPAPSPPGSPRSACAAGPADLARQQAAASVGQGLLVARYTASFARYGVRVGQVLLTTDDTSRRAHYRNAYRTLDQLLAMGALPDRQRERHRRHRRDPLRRQRPARRPRRPPRPRRPAGPALRRGRPLRRRPQHARHLADRRGARARATWPASPSAARARRASAPAAWSPRSRPPGSPPPPASPSSSPPPCHAADALAGARHRHVLPPHRHAAPPTGCCGSPHASTPQGALDPGRRRGAGRRRAPHARCCRPGSPAVEGDFTAGDPVELRDAHGPRGGPRAGQLRRQGDPAAARPLHPRAGARARARRTSARSYTGTIWCSCTPDRRPGPARTSGPRGSGRSAKTAPRRPRGLVNFVTGTTVRPAPCRRPRRITGGRR